MGRLFANASFYSIESLGELTLPRLEQVLATNPSRVQVDVGRYALIPKHWRALDEAIFAQRPSIPLRIYGGGHVSAAFLEHLPHLRALSIESKQLTDTTAIAKHAALTTLHLFTAAPEHGFDFLRALPLTELSLGPESPPAWKADLAVLRALPSLRVLALEGNGAQVPALVPALHALESLTLRSSGAIKGGLGFLRACPQLERLHLERCAIDDHDALAELTALKRLGLAASKIASLDVLEHMRGLQLIALIGVNTPTAFPDLGALPKLRRVICNALASLRDFDAFARTRSVRDFVFYDIRSQRPTDFLPIIHNRSIERMYLWSLKSTYRKQLDALLAENNRHSTFIAWMNDEDFTYD